MQFWNGKQFLLHSGGQALSATLNETNVIRDVLKSSRPPLNRRRIAQLFENRFFCSNGRGVQEKRFSIKRSMTRGQSA